MTKKIQTKKLPPVRHQSPAIDSYFDKYYWLVIPVFAVIYFISSKYSLGFYQDDEIGHFVNMKEFWSDPYVILGNWPKPGYKLVMVVPALFGYQAVIFVNSLIASCTVFFTYKLLKAYNVPYAYFGGLLLAFQPLFFDLSFRSYAEIFTALLFVLMIILYRKEKYFLAGLMCGYIFTVRQEVVLIGLVLAVIFLRRKAYAAIVAIAVFPILFDFLGYLKSGNIFYVINEMNTLGAMDFGGAKRGFFHYFKVYIFIVGPVSLMLFLLGFFGFLGDTGKLKEYFRKYDIVYVVFILTFLVQALLMVKGLNPGTWRYLLHISPLAAFFATVGLNNLSRKEYRRVNYIICGVTILLTLAVMSKTSNGLDLTETPEYLKLAFVAAAFVAAVAMYSDDTVAYLNKLSVILIIFSAVYLFVSFEPRPLSAENMTVKQIGEYLAKPELSQRKVYVTSQTTSPIILFGDLSAERKKNFIHLNSENLHHAVKGDIVIWDSHYGYRPEYKNDVKLEDLQKDSSLKVINQLVSADKRYQAFIFEKIN